MDKTIGISELRKSILQHSQAKAVLLSPDEMETLEITTEEGQSGGVKSAVENKTMEEISSYEKFFGKK